MRSLNLLTHKKRINEDLPVVLRAICSHKYWRQELLFETGCFWLRQQIGQGKEYETIAYQRPFWNWWELRWEGRDFAFRQELNLNNYSVEKARERYDFYHNLPTLCQDSHLIASFYINLSNFKNKTAKDENNQKTTPQTA